MDNTLQSRFRELFYEDILEDDPTYAVIVEVENLTEVAEFLNPIPFRVDIGEPSNKSITIFMTDGQEVCLTLGSIITRNDRDGVQFIFRSKIISSKE